MDELLELEGDLRSSDVFHPAERFTRNGNVNYNLRDYEKAKENFKNALKYSNQSSDRYIANLKYLAMTYTKTGEYHGAKKNYEEVLKILETSPGTDHVNNAHTLNNYAWLCYSTEEYDKARINFEKAQKSFEESLGQDHPDSASCLENLARTCIKTGEYAKAKEFIEKALKIRTKGHDHEDVAKALKIYGLLCYSTGEYDKAKDFFEKALKLFKKLRVPDHVNVADCLNNLGLLYYTTGEYEKAKEFLEKRVETCEKTLGPYHDDVAETLENLVMVYAKTGEYKKANKCLEKAQEIRKKARENCKRAQVAEYLQDDTRLSDNEIFHLSKKIGGNYNKLALLAGMSDKADIVRDNNLVYSGPVEKAKKILTYINDGDTLSRQQLANHLENMGLEKLAGELLRGEFRNPDSKNTREYKKAKKCYENAQEIYEKGRESRKKAQVSEYPEDGARLSDYEIFHLSKKIGANYNRLALLAGMSDKADIVRADTLIYSGYVEKATKILTYLNDGDTFSRQHLANHLEKMGLGKFAGELLRGEFRKPDSEKTREYKKAKMCYENAQEIYERGRESRKKAQEKVKTEQPCNWKLDMLKTHSTAQEITLLPKIAQKTDETIEDALKLSPRVIEQLSKEIRQDYGELGHIFEMLYEVAIVRDDLLKFPSPVDAQNIKNLQITDETDEKTHSKIQGVKLLPEAMTEIGTKKEIEEECETDDSSESEDEDENIADFKKKFLDESCKIRPDVWKKLNSFSWLNGEFGIKWFPKPSFYVTASDVKKEDAIRSIENEFGREDCKYFDVRIKDLKEKPKFRLLSNIKVKQMHRTLSEQNDVSNGTLTMFCCKHNQHFALTCAHVACFSDHQEYRSAFYLPYDVENIPESIRATLNNGIEFFFIAPEGIEIRLGNQAFPKYNDEVDIMAIKVENANDPSIDCTKALLDVDIPRHWNKKWNGLPKKIKKNGGVEMKKNGCSKTGKLVDINYSCQYDKHTLFKNALKVESSEDFLRSGDSGVLVYFENEGGVNVPLGYGVLQNEKEDNTYVCLRLDEALKALDLTGCGCYKTCAHK
ncbi:uncharacterized protein LOC124451240 isoform X1 [Xenia sp. Carnegie-2017]|uniref:uncharacterized protein LOC124451240 isoform X1 n=1 Tax=Xenia sp. Carnegie-2017 TaxID=2897299 RepID=UPI001F043270|nr:uncharacterized protein LOC124451240 isoform X1 [Xenia sp. Carnegie-2017]XP_046857822.1 uncharacterized protein LOC124451240 isoform X1 [Xenia sp. Carnegie-2017]XP_046857823.1 uncharacterized protein LOC124451240 isoform X1 [Xenia sp. Carnegie-2017]XP_046857824.1 uncharacterized protein LOC124451240 isoform X1 [Xenia sp. Carnegie-2017]XP_046857825.1 uncharacterized protein LOC124451240 isoform X1 [Xenia sp. Carnegie-2017]XP_046857826.1 uncharacterized protein LOC124451240 isoform X1 [Xenia 